MDVDLIASRIKKARELNHYTLEDIASDIGVARSTIQRYEKALIKKPKLPVLQAIADSLHVNPAWLAGQNVEMTKDGYAIQSTYDINNFSIHIKNEEELLKHFSKLNLDGEEEAIKRVYELSMINDYTDNQEELWKLVTDSEEIIKKSADDDENFINNDAEICTSSTFAIDISDLMNSENAENINQNDKSYLEPQAAHERTDIEVTDEMQKHDDDIMDDDEFWK